MRRLALALLLVLPATAGAAPFGELPLQPVPGAARCLRATGVPGELLRWAPDGAEVLQATRSGFGAPLHVVLGDAPDLCPLVATQPSGAGLIEQEPYQGGAQVAVRDPGGGWHSETVPDLAGGSGGAIAAAVSERGDAAIAWVTHAPDGGAPQHLLITRRPAGGAFGAPVELKVPGGSDAPDAELGMQADGTIDALAYRAGRLVAVTAAPGAPFGAPLLLTTDLQDAPRLAVAPDGRALARVPACGARTRILERPPAGAFAPVGTIKLADPFFGGLALALRPDGGAIVTYRDYDGQVLALRRDRPGGFGPPQKVGPRPPQPSAPDAPIDGGGAPSDAEGRDMKVTFASDGRPVLTWAPSRTAGLVNWADAAVTRFGGGVQMLGSPLRDADGIAPVMLADGTPAAVWSDVSPGSGPHLHLAVENAPPAPEPPAPEIRLGRVEQHGRTLALPFRCSAACDVRAVVPGGSGGRRSLPAAGSGRLIVDANVEPIVLTRPDSVRMQVVSGAAGARTARTDLLTARLKVPRLPRVLGLRALRHGKRVVVTWRADRPLSRASVVVSSSPTTARKEVYGTVVHGSGQRRFHVSAYPNRGDRYIQLYLINDRDATQRRIAVARIGG
jgi:hypothetical protein